MKVVNVSELKAHLSRYLRIAAGGGRVIVKDRDEPIAQIMPPDPTNVSWRDRLIRSGRLRAGSQKWHQLKISTLPHPVDIQDALRAVRDESDEVPRR